MNLDELLKQADAFAQQDAAQYRGSVAPEQVPALASELANDRYQGCPDDDVTAGLKGSYALVFRAMVRPYPES